MTEKRDPAEALARALEGDEGAVTKEIASLVALARMLEGLPEPQIDATFAGGLEAAILGNPSVAPKAAAVAPVIALRRPSRRVKRALVAAIAAAMVLALPVVASAQAEPGSPLYGLKLRREAAALNWQCRSDQVRCGFTHLDLAGHRIADLRAVVEHGRKHWIAPTTARLNRHLSTGTSRILDARPPRKTLRKLQRRLDRATTELSAIAGFAPPEVREALGPLLTSGADLHQRVALALGDRPQLVPPPFEPPPVVAAPPAQQPPPSRERSAERRPRQGPRNNFGPGGTPRINQPKPGESWSSDHPVRDECPVAVVAAPAVDDVCALAPGEPR